MNDTSGNRTYQQLPDAVKGFDIGGNAFVNQPVSVSPSYPGTQVVTVTGAVDRISIQPALGQIVIIDALLTTKTVIVQATRADQAAPGGFPAASVPAGAFGFLLSNRAGWFFVPSNSSSYTTPAPTPFWLMGDSNCLGSNGAQTGFVGGWRHTIERNLRLRRTDFDFVGSVATMPEKSSMGSLIWNEGHTGEKIEDATTNFATRLARCSTPPKVLVVSLGTNNLLANESAASMLVKFQALAATAIAANIFVMAVPPPPLVDGTTTNASLVALQAAQIAYTALLAAYCATNPTQLLFVDAVSQLNKGCYQIDGVHLNRTGQESMGLSIANVLDAWLGLAVRRAAPLPRDFRQRQPQYAYYLNTPTTDKLTIAGPNGYKVQAANYGLAIDYYCTSLDAASLHTLANYGAYADASFWYLITQQGQKLRVYWNDAAGTIISGPSDLVLQLNRWYRIVILANINGANSSLGLYVNGKLVGFTTGIPAWIAADKTFGIGNEAVFNSSTLGYVSRVRAFSGSGVPAPGTAAGLLAVEDDYYYDGALAPGFGTAHHDLDGALTDDVYPGGPLVVGGTPALTAPWPLGVPKRPWEIGDDNYDGRNVTAGFVALNGTVAAPVVFPGLQQGQVPRLTRFSAAGAGVGGIARIASLTPGTGFSVVGNITPDDSLWYWEVVSS